MEDGDRYRDTHSSDTDAEQVKLRPQEWSLNVPTEIQKE